MSNYNLIIQGPILSLGRTGSTYLSYDATNPKKGVVNFDSKESIKAVLNKYSTLFDQIVIVTWEGEDISSEEIKEYTNCRLIKIKDTSNTYSNPNHPTGQTNLIKQFHSTKHGLLTLEEPSVADNYIVKIRTDQEVDLDALIKEHQTASNDTKKKIFVPFFRKNELSDFYFVAPFQKMLNFCDNIINTQNIPQINFSNTSVHKIMAFAHFYAKHNNNDILNFLYLKSYYPTFINFNSKLHNCAEAKEIATFLNNEFTSFSLGLLHKTFWRGDLILKDKSHEDRIEYRFENEKKLNSINYFIFQTPKQYFSQKKGLSFNAIIGLIVFGFLQLSPLFIRKRILANYLTNK